MALQDLTMMLPSRLGCPLSLETAHMGNPGENAYDLVSGAHADQHPAMPQTHSA